MFHECRLAGELTSPLRVECSSTACVIDVCIPSVQGLAALPLVREWLAATVESTPGPLATALNEVLTGEMHIALLVIKVLLGQYSTHFSS